MNEVGQLCEAVQGHCLTIWVPESLIVSIILGVTIGLVVFKVGGFVLQSILP